MNATHEQDRLTMLIGPSPSEMADAVLAVQSFLDTAERRNEYVLVLTFRELVNNAVEHGNKNQPDKTAKAVLERLEPGRFRLTVEDEGEGFDHEAMDLRMPSPADQMGRRGLPLVHSLVEEMKFNETGAQVSVLVTLPQKITFEMEMQGDWKLIRPTADITGEAAEDFRSMLLQLAEEGQCKYRFDLTQVTEIDSISLSLFVVFNNMLCKRGPEPDLEIVGANRDITRLFHMTRLSRIYHFADQGA